jgi:hypothetical protein
MAVIHPFSEGLEVWAVVACFNNFFCYKEGLVMGNKI